MRNPNSDLATNVLDLADRIHDQLLYIEAATGMMAHDIVLSSPHMRVDHAVSVAAAHRARALRLERRMLIREVQALLDAGVTP